METSKRRRKWWKVVEEPVKTQEPVPLPATPIQNPTAALTVTAIQAAMYKTLPPVNLRPDRAIETYLVDYSCRIMRTLGQNLRKRLEEWRWQQKWE